MEGRIFFGCSKVFMITTTWRLERQGRCRNSEATLEQPVTEFTLAMLVGHTHTTKNFSHIPISFFLLLLRRRRRRQKKFCYDVERIDLCHLVSQKKKKKKKERETFE